MVDYTFYVEDDTGIASKLTQLETRISIDLDITKTLSSPGVDYDNGTKILTISFDTSLTENERLILSRLVDVSILDKTPGIDVQSLLYNQITRDSLASDTTPGSQHDIASYYFVGSRVINPTTNDIWVCTDNTLNNAVWQKTISNLALEGATGATGDAYTGPLTVTNTDVIRYFSDNLVFDITQGESGPLIGIDTPGEIGFGGLLGSVEYKWQSGQGANWLPYNPFSNPTTEFSVGVFVFNGTDSLGGGPTQALILHNGDPGGANTTYTFRFRLYDRTNGDIVLIDQTITETPGTNPFALPLIDSLTVNTSLFSSAISILEMTIINPGGNANIWLYQFIMA